jgi:hypothetical protein
MSITLDLPDELVSGLTDEAQRLGLTFGEYIVRLLATGRASGRLPTTGADLVTFWQEQGIVGSRPDISDSLNHARQVRDQAALRFRD